MSVARRTRIAVWWQPACGLRTLQVVADILCCPCQLSIAIERLCHEASACVLHVLVVLYNTRIVAWRPGDGYRTQSTMLKKEVGSVVVSQDF